MRAGTSVEPLDVRSLEIATKFGRNIVLSVTHAVHVNCV